MQWKTERRTTWLWFLVSANISCRPMALQDASGLAPGKKPQNKASEQSGLSMHSFWDSSKGPTEGRSYAAEMYTWVVMMDFSSSGDHKWELAN